MKRGKRRGQREDEARRDLMNEEEEAILREDLGRIGKRKEEGRSKMREEDTEWTSEVDKRDENCSGKQREGSREVKRRETRRW